MKNPVNNSKYLILNSYMLLNFPALEIKKLVLIGKIL